MQVVIVSYTTTVSYLTGPLLGKALASATEKKAQTAKSDWSEGRSILNECVKEGTEWNNSHPTLANFGGGWGAVTYFYLLEQQTGALAVRKQPFAPATR